MTSTLNITFENPAYRTAGMKAGIKGREKLGVPCCAVDGVEHQCDWHGPTQVEIAPGQHMIETYFRPKTLPVKRGKCKAEVAVAADEAVTVRAKFDQMVSTLVVAGPGRADERHRRVYF
ncbi:hypothetical protein ACIRRA_44395 [Nocardia sp. NPDC101769]|uniref:hypothetical protein n=1 Tax=Nocardia sp. NPDC101769 TaxID=3364333 RepID=UPI00382B3ACA